MPEHRISADPVSPPEQWLLEKRYPHLKWAPNRPGVWFTWAADEKACFDCQSLDGLTWKLPDEENHPVPPLHPHCRCEIVEELPGLPDKDGWIDVDERDLGYLERIFGWLIEQARSRGLDEESIGCIEKGLDLLSGLFPGVNDARDAEEVARGYDQVTGEALSLWERGFTALGLAFGSGKVNREAVELFLDKLHRVSPKLAEKIRAFLKKGEETAEAAGEEIEEATEKEFRKAVEDISIAPPKIRSVWRNRMKLEKELPESLKKYGFEGCHVHHELPWTFKEKFANCGLNVNKIEFGRWVEARTHLRWSTLYNKKWEDFFEGFAQKGMKPKKSDVLDFLKELRRDTKNFPDVLER